MVVLFTHHTTASSIQPIFVSKMVLTLSMVSISRAVLSLRIRLIRGHLRARPLVWRSLFLNDIPLFFRGQGEGFEEI